MRLAVSNIAWNVEEDDAVADLLRRYRVDAVDIAPGKYFAEPAKATKAEILQVRQWWAGRGIEITGMQALLFGTTGLNVFGSPASREAMLCHLGAVCYIGAVLGAKRLVFGSPRNRDRSGLSDDETVRIATGFFRQLGDIAAAAGVIICLEPNPPCYGANFMTTSAETARVVQHVDHPSIRMQLDSGALAINGENPADVIAAYAGLIGHVHASEPDLVPLGDGGTDHARLSSALNDHLPNSLVSIEMLTTQREPHLHSIERALLVALEHYRRSPVVDAL